MDVLNSGEIVTRKRGRIMGSLATISLGKKKLKRKVEEEICKRIVDKLRENLDQAFLEEGITARLKIRSTA